MIDSVPFDDRGLLLGDGLFETILWRDGGPVRFESHLARLARGCAVLGLPAPDAELVRREVLAAGEGQGRAAVRVNWTAGSGGRGLDRPDAPTPRLLVRAFPATSPEGPARLSLSEVRRNDGSPASRIKSLAYLDNVLARAEARSREADEALMLNTRGEVACAAAANVFWVAEGRLYTPALACGVLDGVRRGAVIDLARGLGVEVVETRAKLDALERAEALFLTNSLIGVRPVSELDGLAFAPHALVERLASAAD